MSHDQALTLASDTLGGHINHIRKGSREYNNLVDLQHDTIVFRDEDAQRMTPLLAGRVENLAKLVQAAYGDTRQLLVQQAWDKDSTWKLHHEARTASVQITREGSEAPDFDQLPRLGGLCRSAGFDFVYHMSGANRRIRAAVVRDEHLFFLHERIGTHGGPLDLRFATLNNRLARGWLEFAAKTFSPSIVSGSPRLVVDGPERAPMPVAIVPSDDESELRLGDVLLRTACERGLSPKAYFLDKRSRVLNRPIIRLIPSPVADLATTLVPPSIDSLEASLRRYSDDGQDFVGKGQLSDVVDGLTVGEGRYAGIAVRIHDVLKPQVVDVERPNTEDVSLTSILDTLALDVHGSWYWSGEKRIDLISRPYNEYIGGE